MQTKPPGRLSVEHVAFYWRVKAERRRTVDTQLMRAAGKRMEKKTRLTVRGVQNSVFCRGFLTVPEVNLLSGTVEVVGGKGQTYHAIPSLIINLMH